MTDSDSAIDGRSDFDFLFGSWRVDNRWLADFDDDTAWVEFLTECEARPILGGLGNIDSFSFAGAPGMEPWEAATVRLYDPAADLWRIYWASSRHPGAFDAPMQGRFRGSQGVFYGEEARGDKVARLRFHWTHGAGTARWEQALRFDDDTEWRTNWVMDFTRAWRRRLMV